MFRHERELAHATRDSCRPSLQELVGRYQGHVVHGLVRSVHPSLVLAVPSPRIENRDRLPFSGDLGDVQGENICLLTAFDPGDSAGMVGTDFFPGWIIRGNGFIIMDNSRLESPRRKPQKEDL